MASLRFQFLNFLPTGNGNLNSVSKPTGSRHPIATLSVAVVAAGAVALAGLATVTARANAVQKVSPSLGSLLSLPWCTISLAEGFSSSTVVEPRTGMVFPDVLGDSRKLLGIGLRRKCVLGLKNVDVYAFGIYADENDVKRVLGEKYGKLPMSSLQENTNFETEFLEGDIRMTARLQMVYGKLSIRSVRSAFEESVGSKLQKFGGTGNQELLQRFASQFKDEFKVPRGSVIELSKESGYVLRTTIDGVEIGAIQSKLLCRAVFDLYVGEEPFDMQARANIKGELCSVLQM